MFSGRGLQPHLSSATAPIAAPQAGNSAKARFKNTIPHQCSLRSAPLAASIKASPVAHAACFAKALANHSLNRTHCGVPSFAPPFHSGSNAVTPQCAG